MEKRIAGWEHADWTAALLHDLRNSLLERARPRPCGTADQRRGKFEMAPAAEHDLGVRNQSAGDRAQSVDPGFADADDGQPSRRCGKVSTDRISYRHAA